MMINKQIDISKYLQFLVNGTSIEASRMAEIAELSSNVLREISKGEQGKIDFNTVHQLMSAIYDNASVSELIDISDDLAMLSVDLKKGEELENASQH